MVVDAILFLTIQKLDQTFLLGWTILYMKENLYLCIKGSSLANHWKTGQICLVFQWSGIWMPGTT
jgi:hypothetical protein